MEENDFVSNAVFKAAQRGNPGAVKFGAAYLAKYGRPITDIGIEIVSQQYIKTGDRSLIDPFYNKSLFTASQWNQIATDARRKNSFAGQILPYLLRPIKSVEVLQEQIILIDARYQQWEQKTDVTPIDKEIHNMLYKAYVCDHVLAAKEREEAQKQYEKELQQTLGRFGGNAKLAAKYTWAVKKGYSVFYFPNGLKIENREVMSWRKRFEVKKYTVPVVVVVDFMDIDKEDCYRYKEND
jgi:hypothetical protein